MTSKILFIGGSLNQTTMLHQISQHLGEYECYFTPYYADGVEEFVARMGLLNFTVLGGRHMRETQEYLARHSLPVDYRGEKHQYDLVVTSSDLIIQKISAESGLCSFRRASPSLRHGCIG